MRLREASPSQEKYTMGLREATPAQVGLREAMPAQVRWTMGFRKATLVQGEGCGTPLII